MINDKKEPETGSHGILHFTHKSPIREPDEADISLQLYKTGYQDVTKIKQTKKQLIHKLFI